MDIILKDIQMHTPKGERIFQFNNLTIKSGSRLLILGASGIGKSTLLHLIAGLLAPTQGEIFIGGKNIVSLSMNERSELRKTQMGIIFQKLNLISHMTVKENLQLIQGVDERKSNDLLEEFDLLGKQHHLSRELSLGGQQRVAIIRALLNSPRLLLADEPTSSLDNENASKVIKLLKKLPVESTLVAVSHDERMREHFNHVLHFEELIQ